MVDMKVIIVVVVLVLVAIALGVGLGVDWGNEESKQNVGSTTSNSRPAIVGTSKSVRITNDNLVDEGGGSVRSKFSYTISEPGVPYIAIHFSNFDFNRECTMEITDSENILVVSYTERGRRNRGNFWARHVEGDTMKILVYCVRAAGDNRVIFEIDEVVTGITDQEILGSLREPGRRDVEPERNLRAKDIFPINPDRHRELTQCSTKDYKNAVCYKESHPKEYDLGRRIARMKIAGKGTCTGWLVGPNNLLLSNMHCIENQEELDATDFHFMAEGAECSDSKTKTNGYDVYDAIEIVAQNFRKDYVLIRMDGDPVSKYGYLEIDNRRAKVGETIYIPGHPSGWAKQFVIDDTYPNSGSKDGRCAVLGVGEDTCGYSRAYDTVTYTCDTLGGNSGSPIISIDTFKVLALHHCGADDCDFGNLAVPFEAGGIYMDIKDFIDASAPQTPPPTTAPPTAAPKSPPPTTPKPTEGPPTTPKPTQNPTVESTLRCFSAKIRIQFQLDDFAGETRWEFWQSDLSRMIASGDNYASNALVEQEHCLEDDGVHYLKFFDEFGDGNRSEEWSFDSQLPMASNTFFVSVDTAGFCCGKGFGFYKVWYNDYLLHHENGEFGYETEIEISPDQVCLDVLVHLSIETDKFGVETTWELKDGAGNVVGSGGPYPGQFRSIEETICVVDTGTYGFTLRDSFGDGMCCNAGSGSFKLTRDGELKLQSDDGKFDYFIRYAVPAVGPGEIIF